MNFKNLYRKFYTVRLSLLLITFLMTIALLILSLNFWLEVESTRKYSKQAIDNSILQEKINNLYNLLSLDLLTSGNEPFSNIHAATYRGVYDFADPDSSIFVISTGQSGHFLSRHYDDLGNLWRRGEYVPMSLDPNLARGASLGVTNIVPTETND